MMLSAADAGQTVLCGACGERVAVPPGFGTAGEQPVEAAVADRPPEVGGTGAPQAASDVEWHESELTTAGASGAESPVAEGSADQLGGTVPMDDVPAWADPWTGTSGGRGPRVPAGPGPAEFSLRRLPSASPRPVPAPGGKGSGRWRVLGVVAVAAAAGAIGLAGGYLAGRSGSRVPPGDQTAAIAADERSHSDLVRLKSEAEALAVADRLEAAHAKYQELMVRAAARPPSSPMMWDLVERAKIDQDRIYWILLARMDKAERAFGPGTPVLPNMPTPMTVPDGGGGGGAAAAGGPPPGSTFGADGWGPTPGNPNGPATQVASATNPSDPAATGPVAANPGTEPPPATVPSAVAGTPAGAAQPPATGTAASRPALLVAKVGDLPLRPVDHNLPVFNPAFLDVQIDGALRQGANYLLALFNKDGELPAEVPALEMHRRALHAVATYALLTTGQATDDPRLRPTDPAMGKIIEALKAYRLDGPPHGAAAQPVVYARSMRAAALSVYARPADRPALKEDVDWLIGAALVGAYGPDDRLTRVPKGTLPPGVGNDLGGGRPFPNTQRPGSPRSDASPSFGVPPLFDGWPADGGGPLRDESGRPIELAHSGERIGPPAPPRPKIIPPPPQRVSVVPKGALRVDPMMPGYGVDPGTGGVSWDNLNSQFGAFGVARGAEAGVPVSPVYWKDVTAHWTKWDLPTGQWPFRAIDRSGTFAMTAGGVATLLSAHYWTTQGDPTGGLGAIPVPAEVAAGLAWLATGDRSVTIPNPGTTYIAYDLFALGRAGLATGQKYFGSHDWYPEVATRLVGWQHPNGSWGRNPNGRAENAVETSFHLIFLATGRHPVFVNKLQFDGAWQNRPRDAANAAASLGRAIERPVNWQVVTLDRAGLDWQDAPILYVASDRAPNWTSREVGKVRAFVDGGGLLFLHADSGSAAFNRFAADFAAKLYPQYPLADLPDDHPLYAVSAKASANKPKLRGVSNGSRLLVLLAADDVAGAWQRRTEKEDADAYRILLNLWTYAVGKTQPRPRLDTTDIPPPPGKPAVSLPVARVQYAGNWDPEPGAWPRLGRYTHWEANSTPEAKAVPASELAKAVPPSLAAAAAEGSAGGSVGPPPTVPAGVGGTGAGGGTGVGGGPFVAPMAHLTGTAAYAPTPAEAAGLRAYVEAGGVLLVEACGGAPAFRKSAEGGATPGGSGWLATTFPGLALGPAKPDAAPLARVFDTQDDFTGGVEVRPYVVETLGAAANPADRLQIAPFGKGFVVYCPLDLSTGLSGSKAWGVAGYSPDHAIGIMKNILIWASTRPR